MIDRTTWPPGPWDDEPDRHEWTSATGLQCQALRHESGHWCGYVGVPSGKARGFDSRTIEITGGYRTDGTDWIGFDCGHIGDLRPWHRAWEIAHGFTPDAREVYRTLPFVREQCETLAAELDLWAFPITGRWRALVRWLRQ